MRLQFFQISFVVFSLLGLWAYFWPPVLWSGIVIVPIFLIGVHDCLQRHHAVLKNFPVIGHFRYLMEMVRPELQQYFVESNTDGKPIPRETRAVVYQRAKNVLQTLPFGTLRDVYGEGHEWVNHSLSPAKIPDANLSFRVGGKDCKKPYDCNIFNISGMSFGALSKNAIRALNMGAKQGGFAQNTGEGGVSPYHLMGGDLIWQIGTGYFGCRKPDGSFDDDKFAKQAQHENIKMIEIKLSQGAKPGKGGMLPGRKVTEELAKIRDVEPFKDVISPAKHSAFNTPIEMMHFIKKLRDLSGGKPVGFKLCMGKKYEFFALCKAMVETGISPDFITIDGSEGGTGAAPIEFANYVGTPLNEGLSFAHKTLVGFDLRKDIKVLASGKIFHAFDIINKIALGADIAFSARGMMLALGCIHALRCNSNDCPVGVATTDPGLTRGLDYNSKALRVTQYHRLTLDAFRAMVSAMGYEHPAMITGKNLFRRMDGNVVKSYEEIFPPVPVGHFLDTSKIDEWREDFRRAYVAAKPDSFKFFGE